MIQFVRDYTIEPKTFSRLMNREMLRIALGAAVEIQEATSECEKPCPKCGSEKWECYCHINGREVMDIFHNRVAR